MRGATSVLEKRSFVCDKFGERLFDEKITFWDDGTDPLTLGPSFDFEGAPKQKVVFFDRGRAQDVVYDTRFHYTNIEEPFRAVLTGMPRAETG